MRGRDSLAARAGFASERLRGSQDHAHMNGRYGTLCFAALLGQPATARSD